MAPPSKYQDPYFDFLILNDKVQLLHASFALRYEVYCEDQKFLPAEDYPDKKETDEFDPYSTHIGVLSKKDYNIIGAVRIVKPSPLGLPMDRHCVYDTEFFRNLGYDHPHQLLHSTTSAEISRLVISPTYRRRMNDGLYALNQDGQRRPPADIQERRHTNRPVITLGIFKMIYQCCKRNNITHLLSAMEPYLVRSLAKWQVVFNLIGPEIDYYGPVTPYLLEIADVDRRMSSNIPDLMEEWLNGLEPEYTSWFTASEPSII